jgi:hypothetical protein
MKSTLKAYQLSPATQLRCQLIHVARSRIRHIIRKRGLPLDDPQLVAQVIKKIAPERYQALYAEQGEPENWVTFPEKLSPQVFYNCISGLPTEANVAGAICAIYELDPAQAIAQPLSLDSRKALVRAMWLVLVRTSDRLQKRAEGGEVTIVETPHALTTDFEIPSAIKVNPSDVRVEKSWDDQLIDSSNPDISQFTIEVTVSGHLEQIVVTVGYVFIHQKTGAAEIVTDTRCAVWEGSEVFVGKKRVSVIQIKRQSIHEVVLKKLLEIEVAPLTSISVQLYGIDLFHYQSAYLLADPDISSSERQHLAFKCTALYKALNKLGLAQHQLQVVCGGGGLPTVVYVKAQLTRSILSIAA